MILSNISGFAVRNWQFTLVVFAMLAAIGFNAFSAIPRAEDPELKGPFAVVNVALPGADPSDMEKLVIRPIEDVVNRLDDLKKIESRAEDGLAVITVEFDWSTDPDKKYDDVVREINALRPTLPSGIRRLDINKFRTSLTNIVQVALVSETAPNRVLEDLASDLTDELYRVPGVRDAEVWALPQSEVRVALDFGRLAALSIPVTAVANAVGADARELPGGPIHAGARRFNLKTAGGYDDLEQIRNTVIGSFGGNIVRVRDVAEVSWETEEATYLGWYNGERAAFVTANQKEAQNIFNVRDGIFEVLDQFEKRLPADIRMERAFDQSISVASRLGRLYLDFAIAVSLVSITLLPLGLRAASIVMAGRCVTPVVSKIISSREASALRTSIWSVSIALPKVRFVSQTPAAACPSNIRMTGCRPAASSAAANRSVVSRQVASTSSAIVPGLLIFCPRLSKLAGGSA